MNIVIVAHRMWKLERLRRGGQVVQGEVIDRTLKRRHRAADGLVVRYWYNKDGIPPPPNWEPLARGLGLRGKDRLRRNLELIEDAKRDLEWMECMRLGSDEVSPGLFESLREGDVVPITVMKGPPHLDTVGRVDSARVWGTLSWLWPHLLLGLTFLVCSMLCFRALSRRSVGGRQQ